MIKASVDMLNKQGIKDGLSALADVGKHIGNAVRRAEQRASEAEAELLSLRSVRGFLDLQIEWHRNALKQIEEAEAEAAEKPTET